MKVLIFLGWPMVIRKLFFNIHCAYIMVKTIRRRPWSRDWIYFSPQSYGFVMKMSISDSSDLELSELCSIRPLSNTFQAFIRREYQIDK